MTEEIKKAFEAATTDEEKKAVFEKYKDTIKTLTEEELDSITGGVGVWQCIRPTIIGRC